MTAAGSPDALDLAAIKSRWPLDGMLGPGSLMATIRDLVAEVERLRAEPTEAAYLPVNFGEHGTPLPDETYYIRTEIPLATEPTEAEKQAATDALARILGTSITWADHERDVRYQRAAVAALAAARAVRIEPAKEDDER